MFLRIQVLFFFLLAGHLQAQQMHHDYHAGQLFVKLKDVFPASESLLPSREVVQFFESYKSSCQITQVKSAFWFSKTHTNRIMRIQCADDSAAIKLITALEASDKVEYAERIPISRHFFTPNDLGPNTTTTGGQWYLYKIRAQQAWDIQTGASSIKVAVVDDAMQINHPELQGAALSGFDIADNDIDVNPPTSAWDHGTHIGGLIGANTNNGAGMAGLAFGVKILPVKITSNSSPDILISEYEGVAFAVNQGADVINMSWGSTVASQTGLAVIADAYNAGVVLVAAAGNDGSPVVNYPAGYTGVISVGATNNIDVKPSFSSYGNWIDISAPGSQLWSLAPANGNALKSGTSFSAPLVTAAAALILSADPTLSPIEVESCLITSADNIDIFNPNYIGQLGSGRLNVSQALAFLTAGSAQINAWLSAVIFPENSTCETTFTPIVRVINSGLDTLEEMTFTWRLNNGFVHTMNWTGSILPGLSANISIAPVSAPPGNHVLQISILSTINANQTDAFMANNILTHSFQVISATGIPLPFTETFETGSFATNNWSIENPGGSSIWEIASSSGTSPGSKSARLPYYSDFVNGNRDFLLSPTFNFTGYSAISLSFDYAYQERNPGITDSLIVSISSDCGQTWNRLWARGEDGTYSFATSFFTGNYFIPQSTQDWCEGLTATSCGSINLSPFAGMTGVRIRFEGYNSTGNNIYIDNINISGTSSNLAPVAGFNANGNIQVCSNTGVLFSNTSLNNPATYNWTFEGGSPASSGQFAPIINWTTPGTYDVQLIVSNSAGSDTLIQADFIEILPLPSISITATPDSICQGVQVQLEVSGGAAYLWNAGPGLQVTDSPVVTVSPSVTSTYSASGVSDQGCSNTASSQITVLNPPAAPSISENNFLLVAPQAVSYQWYVNGLEIANSDTMFLQPLLNGNYNLRIYDQYGCTSISAPYAVNWVGVDDVKQQPLLVIPNPANTNVRVTCGEKMEQIQVYSAAGQLIFSSLLNAAQTHLITENWSNGLYLIRIQTHSGERSMRLVVAH